MIRVDPLSQRIAPGSVGQLTVWRRGHLIPTIVRGCQLVCCQRFCPHEKDHPRCTDSMSSTQATHDADHAPTPAVRAQRDAVCPARAIPGATATEHGIAFVSGARRDHGEETAPLRFPVAWIGMRRPLLSPRGRGPTVPECSRYTAILRPVVIAIAEFFVRLRRRRASRAGGAR